MKQTRLFTAALFGALIFPAYSQWTEICGTGNGFVVNFETFDDKLYATGFFNTLCGTATNYVARWDGSGWETAGTGLEEAGHHLQVVGTELYAVRYEQDIDSNWLYRYDGTDFLPVGDGVYLSNAVTGFSQTANLYNLIEYNGEIVVCGEFDRVGNQQISGIMRRSGNQWIPLGTGLSGHMGSSPVMYPHDLCIFGADLVVCGNFLTAGGQFVNGIARWDGSQWHALGDGFNSTVYGIAVYNGQLYAGGDFTQSGITPLTNIARWNGTSWEDPGFRVHYTNPNDYSYVHTLKVLNGKLAISGGFNRAEIGSQTLQCSAVVLYDGTSIDTLHGGLVGKEAEALAIYDGKLYAGGGLNGSSYIARYDDVTSLSEPTEATFRLFPNPSNSIVRIESETAWDELRISDAAGKIVYTSEAASSAVFQPEGPGIYFVTAIVDGTGTTQRISFTD